MSFSPIAFTIPNYRDFKNYWLKAYEPGTTSPKSMATDSTGNTLVAKIELDKDGFPVTSGSALLIPYIDGPYDLWAFPTEAEADANDTSSALRFADNINITDFDEKAESVDDLRGINLAADFLVSTKGYYISGDGGQADYLIKAGATPNDNIHPQLDNGNYAELQDNGSINLEQCGIGNEVVPSDQAAKMQDILFWFNDNDKKHIKYNSTIELSNILVTGMTNLIVSAEPKGILDFKHATSGIGLKIGEGGVGVRSGSQTVEWNNLLMTDSNLVSLLDEMFVFSGGTTGQTPFQTSGFLTINGGKVLQYNNPAGTARRLTNVSHVSLNDWQDAFELGCGYSLIMNNNVSINTGVFNFNNCVFRSQVTPVIIDAASELIDTINFNGGFIGNDVQSLSRECVLLKGSSAIAALNFKSMHWENRHDLQTDILRVEGKWMSGSMIGCHLSGGTSTKKTLYAINVVGAAQFQAIEFAGNEVLRLENGGSGGNIFHLENTAILDIEQPVSVGSWFKNSTTPDIVLVDTGGNEDNIFKSLHSNPNTSDRSSTGRDRMYDLEDSETPSVKGGSVFEINAIPASSQITDFIDEYKGQTITITNISGGAITIVNDAGTIRCIGDDDLVLTNNDAAQFARTSITHWQQISLAIDTSALIGMTATSAELNSLTSDVNVNNKLRGKQVYNTTTNATVTSNGGTAADLWYNADGTLAHTPV